MTTFQPSFKQRIRLLEGAGRVVQAEAQHCKNEAAKRLLAEVADTILTEVEMMKIANKRFEAQREAKAYANRKTAPKGTALTS